MTKIKEARIQNFKKISGSIIVLASIFFTGQAISSTINLNPIKPSASKQPLTDEQQAILAVRTVKASVVNILGLSKAVPTLPNPGNAPSLVATPANEVSGTGFVIEQDGLIVTNNHVVSDVNMDYFVVMSDGTEYPATVLGADKFDDIALLKITATNLIPAKLGDSDALETGQTVFAIGNSLGRYQSTVTKGVVSGLSRAVSPNEYQSQPTFHNWIQTDAAINLGNSGGPLINLAGEVVGMDTLVDTSGASLGFALPVNTLKDAVSQLKVFGKVSRPFLGVKFLNLDARAQKEKNLPVKEGALIVEVPPDGPAKTGGLFAGDIITGVDSHNLNKQNPLDAVIQAYQAGNQVTIKILRGGKKVDLPVVLGELK